MGAGARKIRPDAARDRAPAEGRDGILDPREVLATLETASQADVDTAAARGFLIAATIGALLWAVIIVVFRLLI